MNLKKHKDDKYDYKKNYYIYEFYLLFEVFQMENLVFKTANVYFQNYKKNCFIFKSSYNFKDQYMIYNSNNTMNKFLTFNLRG